MGYHSNKLSDAKIRSSQPKDKPYKIVDGEGLFMLVNPNGAKYWRLAYRHRQKQKTLALGVYPKVTLANARNARHDAKALIQEGIDPVRERKSKKRELLRGEEWSFERVARQWWEKQREEWSPSHADRVLRSLEKEIFPAFGHLPVYDIEPEEVLAAVRRIESRDALDVAKRVLQRCHAVFRFAVQTGLAKTNPASELGGAIKTRKVQHQASLSRRELPRFLKDLDHYQGHPLTVPAIKLLILTFVRPGELRGARWDEFDLKRKEWRIPAERMKMRAEHIVPLSKQALALLDEIKPFSRNHNLLFPSDKKVTKPISENTMTFALYRMGYKNRATAHGFRATASSILNEEGFNRDAIERQLAHQERNKVRGAYTHHAQYLKERKVMMQWWADYLDSL